MSDTDKNLKPDSHPKEKKNEVLVPIEADEIVIDCRGLDTKVLIDGREIYLEYFKVELDINGTFTNKATNFHPRVLFGIRAKKLRFLQSKDGVKYRGSITEVGVVEKEGKFLIEYRSDDRKVSFEEEDDDRPSHLEFETEE